MSDDADHVVLVLPRGNRGEVRVARSRYEGHVFTRLQLFYPSDDGTLRPGKQCITVRDHELGDVIDALRKIEAHVTREEALPSTREQRRPPATRQPDRRTGDLTGSDRSGEMEAF